MRTVENHVEVKLNLTSIALAICAFEVPERLL